MTETPDSMETAADSTEMRRLEPKWLRVIYTLAIETNEPKVWMDAASINERPGSVSNWLRVTYTSETEMVEKTKSTKAAKESSVIQNVTTVTNEMWILYFNVFRIGLHFWAGCNEHVDGILLVRQSIWLANTNRLAN